LRNYLTLFADSVYWRAWLTTFEIALIQMPILYILGFVIANMLVGDRKGANFFRSVYYLPAVVGAAIVGLVFSNLFDYYGPVNVLFTKLGFIKENVDWYANKGTAIATIVTANIWSGLGTQVLYFMAALSTVPKELYESADVEGAGTFTKYFKITIPMIAPTLQILIMLTIINVLGMNDMILVMTNGAPAGSTHTIESYITSRVVPGFSTVSNIGYSASMSIIKSIIVCSISLTYNHFSNKMKNLY
jgi:raffinose/stachyose/melibiose transport system permease protein